ncbi:MAG: KTSC domain-containing protein [Chitinophagales bacterium]|nr:KTSC domain-containing protein [Chitinophagales bacterium]
MSLPEMIIVSSSNITSIGYDEQNQQVYVRFQNGSLYVYKGVPAHEYLNLLEAPSQGSYLNRSYKNVYPYERIE